MSDEVTQVVQVPAETGTNTQASETPAVVENQEVQSAVEQPVTESAVSQSRSSELAAANTSAGQVKEFHNNQEIVARLGVFDASGAEECRFADGTTGYVPKN